MTHSTPLDLAADRYVHDMAALIPTLASAWGLDGYEDQLQDYSPDYHEQVYQRTARMLAELDHLDGDPIAKATMRDRLGVEVAMSEQGEDLRDLNNIASPIQDIRDTLVQMGETGRADRLRKVPQALEGYRQSLALAADRKMVAAQRQIHKVIAEIDTLISADTFNGFGPEKDINKAYEAFAFLRQWLKDDLLPQAPHTDAFGRERYELLSHLFVGARVDLDEAYEWGNEQLKDIIAQQHACAAELYGPDMDIATCFERLDREDRYTLRGVPALQQWMQRVADAAVNDLAGIHFEIPQLMRTIEACIDPAGTGGIFYTQPSADFSRPGRMWWSVPEGEDTFHTWQELTTVYHEGVPGHHLQLGTALLAQDRLNLWRRIACWNSGHGEGWALYAESLMAELGYFDDPGYRMGYLDAQRLRAARVVLDIGVHLEKKNPDGGVWDYDYARAFLRRHVAMAESALDFEIHRYLGWAGQAPSYALGQRLWQELRADAATAGMSAPEFHAKALSEGSIPMDILRQAVLG
ncbi:DUF885 domain-containing protein [Corynebacterium sp. ES2794-CONJ1]|uniref:DUF885 domain-containing protein n=1 Tax=unclassified Corynebacterium TaxID=2624378 RepID=UPI00216A9532|nr:MULTISPECIES: DUF885 domain-containing protein [unclassified Corynebacterium]MCS4489733.1 DUF885 domain-containing protein [Corynebacterium sp. ES2775-CONJ]MCS4531645.1 DUF885 domain-containing protein [Corynebacterium sp. ES2730-CONJ]MCU9519041.1 DUF885 domain-containing protein [Corynebacterium sp. ES2794-CONJ1]